MRPRKQSSRESLGIRALRSEVSALRRANESRERGAPARAARVRRRRQLLLATVIPAAILVLLVSGAFQGSDSFRPPSRATLAGLNVRQRIVAIARSQVGYGANPSHSYCNKFSSYWDAGTPTCPSGELAEEWCADFAAWAWQQAGVHFTYGYGAGELNASAASFYTWGLVNGRWHPSTSGYRARAGDVAVYGLILDATPFASHVAIVTSDPAGQAGPDVINGDGDRTGFSVVESGTDQTKADVPHHQSATLAGYVSPP